MDDIPEGQDEDYLQREAQDVMRRVKSFWLRIAIVAGCALVGAGYFASATFGGFGILAVVVIAIIALALLGWYLLDHF